MKITSTLLRRLGACTDGKHAFRRLWPKGVEFTREALVAAMNAPLNIFFFLPKILPSQAYAELCRSWTNLQAERDRWQKECNRAAVDAEGEILKNIAATHNSIPAYEEAFVGKMRKAYPQLCAAEATHQARLKAIKDVYVQKQADLIYDTVKRHEKAVMTRIRGMT